MPRHQPPFGPAKAGTQGGTCRSLWIPAFAGMIGCCAVSVQTVAAQTASEKLSTVEKLYAELAALPVPQPLPVPVEEEPDADEAIDEASIEAAEEETITSRLDG